ncbi:HTH-type transcriptional regulator gltC [Tatumella ptyseos]|nr:HTH-type transcriptional regulator gltC [Tatumella ptyseos]
MNLDLDLLRTFVAVADLNTFAAAAAAVCRTQSAVSQQMQRLEQLVGKELFARHGRNKLLTEHGIQLLGYARKILRFNDEACASLMYSNVQGILTIGVTEDTAETLLPYVLNRITTLYPKLTIDIRINPPEDIFAMLEREEVDLVLATKAFGDVVSQVLRTSPTLWFCAADYAFRHGEALPLVLQDEPNPFREMAIEHLDKIGMPWRISYVAASLSAVKVAVKSGLGATARPAEMIGPDVRVLGSAEYLPQLPDTQYLLCRKEATENELLQSVFNVLRPLADPSHPPAEMSEDIPEVAEDIAAD